MLDPAHIDDHLGEVPLVAHDGLHTRLCHLHWAVIRGGELPALETNLFLFSEKILK